ncbi:MAG TPA: delta-60 repeat domain-containing protein, partial [Rhodothermales bacterium]|nr:delta-60 repeat domain-containing protein [Rhodothermales bacterium]
MRSRFLLIAALAVAFPARAQTGQLDASFGDRGIVLGPILNSTATGVAVDAHHNIIVAGTVLFPTPTQQAGTYLARYTPEGTLDPTFGDGGIVFNPSVDAEVESGRVVVLPDQSYFTTERRRAEGAAYHTVYATRVQPDGVRTCYVGVTNGAVVNGMAVTPQGEVVLMEGSPSSTWSILSVLQVDVNYTTGACRLDPEFGNMGGASFFFPTGVYGLGHDVAIQPDGRILIAGLVQPTPGEIRDAEPVVARLMPRGTMDFSFGSNHRGYVMHKPRGVQQAIATDIALSPDGTIVVSGFGER